MSMEKRKIYYTHRRSNLNCQVHWKFGGLLWYILVFFFFSRKDGREEFIDQQPEYQLLHEDTVRYS
jgi:hypothetical protein